MKMKASELNGAALDWAAGFAIGHKVQHSNNLGGLSISEPYSKDDRHVWSPSTDWSQGGPLIEQLQVAVDSPRQTNLDSWQAQCWDKHSFERGPTPLIAACRAIVAAKLGNEVDVPDELMQ